MKKFLYLHRGALGDFVLSIPALRMIKTEFPKAEFIGLSRPDHLKLASDFSLCEKALNCESAIFAKFLDGEEIPKQLDGVDSAILRLKDGEKVSSLLSSAGSKVLLIDPFANIATHTGKRYFQEAVSFFFPNEGKNIADYLPQEACNLKKNTIIIHPGSGSKNKNMPADFYLELACEFRKLKIDYRFILGPAELERAENKFFPAEKTLFPTNCVELKNIILNSLLFIGNDSGPSHLAGFCGIPTIAIFAKTSPEIWKPMGRKIIVINPDEIEIKKIITEAKKLVAV